MGEVSHDERSISRNVALLKMPAHYVITIALWTEKRKYPNMKRFLSWFLSNSNNGHIENILKTLKRNKRSYKSSASICQRCKWNRKHCERSVKVLFKATLFGDHHQISLIMLSSCKRKNWLLYILKWSESFWFSFDFRGNVINLFKIA